MKKWKGLLSAFLAFMFCLSAAAAEPTVIQPDMNLQLSQEVLAGIAPSNPEEEGLCPLTGLPMVDEPYTPISLVLDDSPEVFPHWGVADADWIAQVPLRRDGATRLVAVYGSRYPEQAGGVRSARMTTFSVATLFTAAAASGCWPPNFMPNVNVEYWIDELDYNKPIRYYNLLGTKYRERVSFLPEPWNLSAHIREIHDSLAKRIKKGTTAKPIKFESRFFRFADEPLSAGDAAASVGFRFINRDDPTLQNLNSACTFAYTEGQGYTRDSSTGPYADRDTGEVLSFANVIVLRTPIEWEETNYPYYLDQLKGCGQAELFQSGRHVTGAWYRKGMKSRLVLLDDAGQEIPLQRGRTFLVIGDEFTSVSYE